MLSDQVELQAEKLDEIQSRFENALTRLEGADSRLQEVGAPAECVL